MRDRIFLWFGRVVAILICAALATLAGFSIVEMRGKQRLRTIAERDPSNYVKQRSATVVLDHVRVIDGTGAASRDEQSIVIQAGKIAYVGPRVGQPNFPESEVLDLSGRSVFPGMVALHEHLFTTAPSSNSEHALVEQSTVFPLMYLAAGVTTMRTAGSISPERDLKVKQKIDEGTAVGPEMFLTAPYLEGQPPTLPEMHGLTTAQEARSAVDHWADRGMTSFKAYMNISPQELQEAVRAAHSHGLKITAHLCSLGFRQAVDLGIDNLEHGLLSDTEFYSKKEPDTCPDFRFYLSEYNAELNVQSRPVQDMIRYLVSHHVAITSTLAVFESELGGVRPEADSIRAAHAMTWKAWRASRERVAAVPAERVNNLLRKEQEFERDFERMGGTLLAGCDPTGDGSNLAGFGDQREVELLVDAGFTAAEAIKIATKNGAEFLGIADQVGTILVGKQADLVVVDGDPARNISDIKKVDLVFRRGVGYDPLKLMDGIYGVVGLEN
jgi:imidazolonepropionase-like amidohydrolase